MGKEGLEPSRLSAHDPKSCLSASSSTSPQAEIISETLSDVNKSDIIRRTLYRNVNVSSCLHVVKTLLSVILFGWR